MIRRARFHAGGAERGRKGGGDPQGRDRPLREDPRLRGAAHANQAKAQSDKGGAPSFAVHIDIEISVEDAASTRLGGLEDGRGDLRPPGSGRVVA
eukprot:14957942-Alexandrium_andersonii.AAC.1